MKTASDTKENLLKNGGFRYNFDRMVYINRASRKVFSVEAIKENSEEWLSEKISERSHNGQWSFYFLETPPPAIVRDFLAEFDARVAAR